MELTLNLGWVLVALAMLFAWLRVAPRDSGERRAQFVALAVVILILLPAISMTDDLIAAQNPAEVDCCSVRRDSSCSHVHLPMQLPALPLPPFAIATDSLPQMRLPGYAATRNAAAPAPGPVEIRPPPAV
jgi:hypothetical protein